MSSATDSGFASVLFTVCAHCVVSVGSCTLCVAIFVVLVLCELFVLRLDWRCE